MILSMLGILGTSSIATVRQEKHSFASKNMQEKHVEQLQILMKESKC